MEPVNPLGPEARACLQAYRREMPTAAAFARDWSRVRSAIDDRADIDDASDDLHAVALDPRGSAGRWAVATGLAFAIAAAVLLLLRGVIGAATALGVRGPAPMEAVDHAQEDSSRQARTRAARAEATTASAGPDATRAVAGAEAVDHVQPPRVSSTPVTISSPAPAPDGTIATTEHDAAQLAEETRLLREAREALAAGDAEAALRSLAAHEREFPEGALVEERMLYRAIARCRSEDTEPAADFLRRFPKSPHAPRVRSECGAAP